VAYRRHELGKMNEDVARRIIAKVADELSRHPATVIPEYVRKSLRKNGLTRELIPQPVSGRNPTILDTNYRRVVTRMIDYLSPTEDARCEGLGGESGFSPAN
jgi:hypothetical protein